ncbi:MAG: transglycosylase SLT domain-containing protein, partial [Chloroflexota bacterium]
AIQTYQEFVDRAPEHPQAPEFLYFAARTAERFGDLAKAAKLWQQVGTQFSTSSYAYDGLFQAGIARYRLRDYNAARSEFQSALGLANDGEEKAAAYFWLGKSQAANGRPEEAWGAWQQAISSDPSGYYSERARDISAEIAPFTPPETFIANYDFAAEIMEAEAWLKATFALSPEVDLNGPGNLLADPRFIRGAEMWKLGLYNDARLEFESVRVEVASNAELSYRLANYLLEIGLYRSGIIAARQVLNLAGMTDETSLTAPNYFNHLRFGLYFDELIFPVADAYGFDPLFIYSVMRQESLFEGFVTSSAGARGLMQIIPSTGQNIFENSGWPSGYTGDDLYRPIISITFGADYLSDQLRIFDHNPSAALAAYNGGPGNVTNWLALAPDDPDLFVEVIRFEETRRYLRSIYEQFTIYKNIYQAAE